MKSLKFRVGTRSGGQNSITRETLTTNGASTWCRFPCNLPNLINSILTYSMEHSPSSNANRFSASPEIYGTRRFITTTTSARHLFLSWARSIQSMPSHPTSWTAILICFSHLSLGLPSRLLPSGFLTNTLHTPLPRMCYTPRPSHFSLFDSLNNIGWEQIIKLLVM